MSYRIVVLCFITLTACQKVWVKENPPAYAQSMVDSLWRELNDHYVFFDLKDINWDLVYEDEMFKVSAQLSDDTLFDILSHLLGKLKDGHAALYAGFDTWKYHDVFEGAAPNFNANFVEAQYLESFQLTGPFKHCVIDNDIGYLYIESFGDDFTSAELKYLIDQMNAKTTGLIIDIRDNQGGALDRVMTLMGVFTNASTKVGEMYWPDENGQLTDQEVLILAPHADGLYYDGDVVVLTNRRSYSASSVFAAFMQDQDMATIIGDTTGGGGGLAVSSVLANGWTFRYAAGKITLPNQIEIELGVAPDIYVSTGPANELLGKDAVIEKAITLLN